jgi:hypothetical protein
VDPGEAEEEVAAVSDRPVPLTFPSVDQGWVHILANGVQVGHVRKGYRNWEAWLWNESGNREGGYAAAPVLRERLGDVRAELRERLEAKGPWWTCEP